LEIEFTDLSENAPQTWQWDFGDGAGSTQANPVHTYENAGIYTVSLIVSNANGSDELSKTDFIEAFNPNPPDVDFIADVTHGPMPLQVNFTDLSTNDPNSWYWDFGDGNISFEQNPSHTYTAVGTYTVSLEASNGVASGELFKSDYINVIPSGSGEPCPGIPTVNYEGQVYNTVLIGDQCWLKENLNVGEKVSGDMADNGQIEKWCYAGVDANCDKYGALYQWKEAMQYNFTEGSQGICPDGWHIPTSNEWKILEGVADSQIDVGSAIWDETLWRGIDCGIHLKSHTDWEENGIGDNITGFTALPAGHHRTYSSGLGTDTFIWTSTSANGGLTATYRRMDFNQAGIYLYTENGNYGHSVRCLKD